MTESKMSTQIASPRAMSMMHDWTSVNGWSRPTTKAEHGTRLEVSGARSQLALRRCQTNMEKQQVFRPLRRSHVDSCTMDFIKHLENLNKAQRKSRNLRRWSKLALRCCQTNMEKQQVFRPLRRSNIDSCTMAFVKHLENLNKETEAKLKDTMQVLSLHRSKTEMDCRDSPTMFENGLLREKTHMYLTNLQNLSKPREPVPQPNKQEMKIGLAVVPRKGLIALQTTGTEMHLQQPFSEYTVEIVHHGMDNEYGQNNLDSGHIDRRQASPVLPLETGLSRSRSLIKRNRILHHIKLGAKRLEQDEENKQKEAEMSKHIGDYTVLDLQTSLLELTDTKTMRRHTSLTRADLTSHQRAQNQERVQKSVTLPAIRTLTPFKMK